MTSSQRKAEPLKAETVRVRISSVCTKEATRSRKAGKHERMKQLVKNLVKVEPDADGCRHLYL